jgi:transposase-like protein
MKNHPSQRSAITAAQRGQIIQRVIVDGWTSAAAASSFGVSKRLVDIWVADFRRNGMASLRREPGRTAAATILQLTVARPLRAILRKMSSGLRRPFAVEPIVQPLPLRRSNEDGPR